MTEPTPQFVYFLLCVMTVVQGEEVSCGLPPSILNGSPGTLTVNTLKFDGTVTYSCEPGYTLSGSPTVTCQDNGKWSSLPSCDLPSVYLSLNSTLYLVNNSKIDFDNIGENNELALSCHTDSTVCCNGGSNPENNGRGMGQWLYPSGTAVSRRNFDVTESETDILYRSRSIQIIRLHRRGNLTQPTGLYCCMVPVASGEETVFCAQLVTEDISTTMSTISSFCGSPPSIANGSPGTPSSAVVEKTVTYSCDPGYIHSGSATVTCLSTGEWSTPPICQVTPPVYLSLSSTNYVSTLSEIPLSSVGEGRGNSLVCHTNLPTCCSGEGAWHYPNGSEINVGLSNAELYVTREQMSVSLNYRGGVSTETTGLYCCVIPTSQGTLHQCIILGSQERQEVFFSSHYDLIGAIVGCVVGGVVIILLVCLSIAVIIHVILRYRRGKQMSVSSGLPLSRSDSDRNAAPLYETVPEAISVSASRHGFELIQNEAYGITAGTESGCGN